MWQGDKMLVIFPLVLPTLNSKPFITNSIHHEMIYFKLKYMSHPEVHKFNLLSGLISYQHLITEDYRFLLSSISKTHKFILTQTFSKTTTLFY